jgi:hypothetical protein
MPPFEGCRMTGTRNKGHYVRGFYLVSRYGLIGGAVGKKSGREQDEEQASGNPEPLPATLGE